MSRSSSFCAQCPFCPCSHWLTPSSPGLPRPRPGQAAQPPAPGSRRHRQPPWPFRTASRRCGPSPS
jgi:hypothetical protein